MYIKKKESVDVQACLKKLEKLKDAVKESTKTLESCQMSKYRIDFSVNQPSILTGTLEQHQLQALQWMINLGTQEANGILADDMGLGKTIQAISYIAYLRQQHGIKGKHIVICPKSVSLNWIRQIKKWLPMAEVALLPGTQIERNDCIATVVKPRKFDILVTTYDTLRNCFFLLRNIHWEVLIVDEAHKIKNFNSRNFQYLSHLEASFKLLLTGTPLSNYLQELWVLLNFIMPHIFTDPLLFQQLQLATANLEESEENQIAFRIRIAKDFHKIISPYFKRRSKKELQLGLPPKIEKTLFVPLSKMQLNMYRNFLRYDNVYGEGFPTNKHLMECRKICLHPYLFDGFWPEGNVEFGQHAIENCGKLRVLDQLLRKFLANKHKVLIFSQFAMLLDILEEYCEYRKYPFCRLDGNTELEDREQMVHDFNQTNKYKLFLLSTKAGGLGINLTGADRVVIYDIDWNPQNDIQAMDRAYRIGQTKAVHVYKLITEFTIEERISDFQKYKLIWDDLVIQKSTFLAKNKEDPFESFNYKSLMNLGKGDIFRLEVDQNPKTLQQIIKIGELKDKKKNQQIKKRLMQVDSLNISKINPFQADQNQDSSTIPPPTEQELRSRRVYPFDKREFSKFQRNYKLPAFKFYLKCQKIRQLEFQIHMEIKKSFETQNQRLLEYLNEQLVNAKNCGKFENWSQQEFNLFVIAHKSFFKEDYKQIASFIKSKTTQQVQLYSKFYFQKAPNNDMLTTSLQTINLAQNILNIKTKLELSNIVPQRQSNSGKNLSFTEQENSNLQSTQDIKGEDYLTKVKKKLIKECQFYQSFKEKQTKRIIQQKLKEAAENKQKLERERQQQRKIREQQKRIKAQERIRKQQERKTEKLLKQQQKKIRQEQRQKLIQQRKIERQKQKRQKQLLKIEKEEALAKKRQTAMQQQLQKGQGRIKLQSKNILKAIERDSLSSKTRSSNQSKKTEIKGKQQDPINLSDEKSQQTNNRIPNPLEIVVARQ